MTNWPKPFPYQKESVKAISHFGGRSLLALDMGLGKTLITLRWLYKHQQALPALVVCPASVKYHWEREAEEYAGFNVAVLEGRDSRNESLSIGHQLIVINYDILKYWLSVLKSMHLKTVVLDESQYISNHTQRTKAVRLICKGVDNVLALSGTPLMNKPIELFNALQILDPVTFKYRKPYIDKFCDPKLTPWGWKYDGATNTKELNQLLRRTVMIRYRKKDVLAQLPDKQRRLITLPLESRTEYDEAYNDFLAWLEKQDSEKAKRAARAEAMVRAGYLLRLAAKLKLPYVIEWAKEFLDQTDEKLIIFAVHREIIQGLEEGLPYESVVVDGSVRGRNRDGAVSRFQRDEKVRLFIGNVKAAGIGITLTAASTVAFAELTSRPADMLQAEDRCHRIGQTKKTWHYYLLAHRTIEDRYCRLLQKKLRVISSVLDGEEARDFDVLNGLMGSLLGRKL